jgi:hypothetical protein
MRFHLVRRVEGGNMCVNLGHRCMVMMVAFVAVMVRMLALYLSVY